MFDSLFYISFYLIVFAWYFTSFIGKLKQIPTEPTNSSFFCEIESLAIERVGKGL